LQALFSCTTYNKITSYLLTLLFKHPPLHSLTVVTTVRSLWRNYYKFKGYIVQCQMATTFSELHLLLEDNHVHICHCLVGFIITTFDAIFRLGCLC